jgi:hypothetical protein
MATLRLRFWLAVLDTVFFFRGFGSPLYLWVVGKCSDADWARNTTASPSVDEKQP